MQREQPSYSSTYLVLLGLFTTCLLVSNVIAGRLIEIGGIVLPSAVILFPVTYILGDVFTEVYGFRKTRLVIWVGFAANLLMSAVFLLALALPAPGFFTAKEAYATVLGLAPRMVLASLLAYWLGEFGNSITLSLLKKATKGRFLWTRTISSTVVGQALDTGVFILVGFVGSMSWAALLGMMLAQYLFKVLYEVVCTPLTYAVVGAIKRRERIDTFDNGVVYNPFALGGK